VTASLALLAETLAAFGGDESWARGPAEMKPEPEQRAHWQREFWWLLDTFRFLHNDRGLYAVGQAGVGHKAVPTSCFILLIRGRQPPSTYHRAKETAITCSRGRAAQHGRFDAQALWRDRPPRCAQDHRGRLVHGDVQARCPIGGDVLMLVRWVDDVTHQMFGTLT